MMRNSQTRRDSLDPEDIYKDESLEQRNFKAKAALSIRSEHTLRSENLPFDIDVWYPTVAQFTFPSYFLPLNRAEARAIINMYQTSILRRTWLRIEDVDVLRNLEKRIDEMFKEYFQGKTAFMRLCGRSPKDADPLNPENVLAEYKDELEKLAQKYPGMDTKDPNTRFVAFTKVNWMKVTNAREVMNLLLTSERVHVDMDDWLRYGEPEQIVLREFEPDLTIDNEFRAFVYRNQMNGISQYDHYGVFPHLDDIKDEVQEKILALWEQVHPHIGEESYVVDFGYLPTSGTMKLIEISPFLTCTGAACFRWTNDRDLEILQNGPLDFRLNRQSHITEGLVQAGIYDRFKRDTHRKRYWDFLEGLKPSVPPPFPYEMVLWPCIGALLMYWGGVPAIPSTLLGAIVPILYTRQVEDRFKKDFYRKYEESVQKAKSDARKGLKNLIFFYGTLKKGFHWNQKFLCSSELLCKARSVDLLPLVVGDCGVPYILGDRKGLGKHVLGEVWLVSDESLKALDDYEGIRKGYYTRERIEVTPVGEINPIGSENLGEIPDQISVFIYFKKESDLELLEFEFIDCYDMEMHKRLYKPIRHIQVKQRAYLGLEYDIGH